MSKIPEPCESQENWDVNGWGMRSAGRRDAHRRDADQEAEITMYAGTMCNTGRN